jgi:hypothetical protein
MDEMATGGSGSPFFDGLCRGTYMAHALVGLPLGIALALLGHWIGWLMIAGGVLAWWGWARDFGLRGHPSKNGSGTEGG